jgi:hypothetical protein
MAMALSRFIILCASPPYFIQGDIEYHIEGRRYNIAPESLLLIPPTAFTGLRSSLPIFTGGFPFIFCRNCWTRRNAPCC